MTFENQIKQAQQDLANHKPLATILSRHFGDNTEGKRQFIRSVRAHKLQDNFRVAAEFTMAGQQEWELMNTLLFKTIDIRRRESKNITVNFKQEHIDLTNILYALLRTQDKPACNLVTEELADKYIIPTFKLLKNRQKARAMLLLNETGDLPTYKLEL